MAASWNIGNLWQRGMAIAAHQRSRGVMKSKRNNGENMAAKQSKTAKHQQQQAVMAIIMA